MEKSILFQRVTQCENRTLFQNIVVCLVIPVLLIFSAFPISIGLIPYPKECLNYATVRPLWPL